ncbi:4-(cytidine 5'-diphospho)-2-C-methyl-D-erythritol kinase [Reichenbachiella agarivorans]|uniref:4-diphosphocytidyl-2-C-methyl-D-erythritol kinase n=1 Tax=Reichenbachiella agarivorans TaxID=2979464 RepID=A0ABY6CMQ8_9BACT|nr:4-(cytidine 5'-diphospho)-2-C-methyl-D-erythritol kinase [Reichenbachiella agarivorans]UXP30643.1 4-(cytidine 5'-diphospho)-2-C-methyl-D-erythritol kinase [Reichenbachiella agarivorans]
MIAFPNAKINLGLNILSRRPDGYHNISSCFLPVSWRDILEIIPSDTFSFHSSGLSIPGDFHSNLVVKAYEMLRADFDLSPVEIHLHKVIPMGAGMGGGSSDGAFALKLLNELFALNLDHGQLEAYAKKLGADCPFFIQNKPRMVGGIGDVFEDIDLDLKGYQLLIVYPEIHINTKLAFQSITPQIPKMMPQEVLQLPILDWKDHLVNDFERPVFAQHPSLATLKEELYQHGALYASMSGSGSSVFGIFDSKQSVNMTIFDWKSCFITSL